MNALTLTIPVADGALVPSASQKEAMSRFLQNRNGRAVAVKFSVPTLNRSLSQNKYYWGVLLTLLAEHTGHTTEDLHLVMKDMFLPRKFLKLGTKEVCLNKTTTDLTTTEFQTYLEQIRAWAVQELGLQVPDPN